MYFKNVENLLIPTTAFIYLINKECLSLKEEFKPPTVNGFDSSIDYIETNKLKVATIIRSLIKNHYFPDGNKRSSLAVFLLICKLNNLEHTTKRLGPVFENIAQNSYSVEEIAEILFK